MEVKMHDDLGEAMDINDDNPAAPYQHFGQALSEALAQHHPALMTFHQRVSQTSSPITDTPFNDVQRRMNDVGAIVTKVDTVLTPAAVGAAFGGPGVTARPDGAAQLVSGLSAIYGELLSWGQSVLDADVPAAWRATYVALSRCVDAPLQEMTDFADEFVRRANIIATDMANNRAPSTNLVLTLAITLPDDVVAAVLASAQQAVASSAPPRRRGWFRR